MFADSLVAELIDFAYQAVEEVAVVAYDNQRTVEVHQCLLQDVLGLQVEVVGGFVQDKEVHRLEQQPDHGQTGTLAAGEHLDLLHRGFGTAEHEGAQQVAYLVAYLALGHVVDGLEDGQVLVEQGGLVLGEVTAPCSCRSRSRCAFPALCSGGQFQPPSGAGGQRPVPFLRIRYVRPRSSGAGAGRR